MPAEHLRPVQPIVTASRFAELNDELVTLLKGLTAEDWGRPTMCSSWNVKDVTAHLLDTDLRRLSSQRDAYVPEGFGDGIETSDDLTRFLNRLNEEWVATAKRLSPAILIEMIDAYGKKVAALFESLDPDAEAIFPVSWVGQNVSPNWLDVAREFTEKWVHQAQIREAVERDGLNDRRFLHPVLDTFLRALPFTYRGVEAPEGTVVGVHIRGDAGGDWSLRREDSGWELYEGRDGAADARALLDQDVAWRLFSTRKRKQQLMPLVQLEGREDLAAKAAEMISVVA
jgi:uncharacterized protein (TIGR03083 family)